MQCVIGLSHLSLFKPADSSSTERHSLGQYNFKQYWSELTGADVSVLGLCN